MRAYLTIVIAIVSGLLMPFAIGAPIGLVFDSFDETKTYGIPFGTADAFRIEGVIPTAGGAISNILTFTQATNSPFELRAAWITSPGPLRTTGVNIDLMNASNEVVATDSFLGVVNGQAFSSFSLANLQQGTYSLRFTGIAPAGARYRIDVDSALGSPATDPIPVTIPTAPVPSFDTLLGTKKLPTPLVAGDSLRIDSLIPLETGAIVNDLRFTVGAVLPLSAGITWFAGPGALRTLGVNVDLFDFSNSLVASDVFEGIDSGQAFSELITTLIPGSYLLRFSGIAIEGARYRIDLATDGSLPDFSPIPANPVLPPSVSVPEPATLALFGIGLAGLGFARRKQ